MIYRDSCATDLRPALDPGASAAPHRAVAWAGAGAPARRRAAALQGLDALVNMLEPVGLAFDVHLVERPPVRAARKVKRGSAVRSGKSTAEPHQALSG